MSCANERNCRLEYDDASIAWLYLDCREASTNTMSTPVLRDLGHVLDELEKRGDLKGLVILSAKDAGFVAAPSTDELAAVDDMEHVEAFVQCGQSVMDRIAALTAPTVALTHGHCLGSGLELALACRYRAADQAGSALGFPDVRLGLHPCHGGTARLPSLIGSWQALNLLRSGGSVNAARAVRLGLVDAVVPGESLADTARDLIARDPGRQRAGPWNVVFHFRVVRRLLYKLLDYELQRKPCPEKFPATYAILRLWRDHAGRPPANRLRAERDSLLRLIQQPASRNLVRAYLLQDRLQKEVLSLDATPPRRVHVFGAGVMGGGVAALLALHGRQVTLHDPDEQALRSAEARAQSLFEQHLEEPDRVADARARLSADTGDAEVAHAELVIEAVDEDLDAKQALFQELEARLAPDAVIATATTTLLIEELCRPMERPERLIGLHFFRPVEHQPLVEVVAGGRSGEQALAIGQALIAAAHKLPLRVRSGPGFLVTRLQLPYMLQGAAAYARPRREVIDAAGLKFGMPHGPLELADAVGLDVCQKLAESLGYAVPESLSERVEAGQLGQRTGKGFHDWKGERRVTASVPPGEHHFQKIARELIDPVLREAARCRDEHVVADSDLVDVGTLFGAGFPAHTGGPLTLLRERDGEPDHGQPTAGR